jgi:HEAT repeat protein
LDKGEIRELLLSYVHNPREQVRLSAMTALGNLEDSRAIAVLETFGSSSAYRPERSAAEKALEKIRTVQKPNEEIKGLRTELSTLRDLSRDLKKELETLKKKMEAKP